MWCLYSPGPPNSTAELSEVVWKRAAVGFARSRVIERGWSGRRRGVSVRRSGACGHDGFCISLSGQKKLLASRDSKEIR